MLHLIIIKSRTDDEAEINAGSGSQIPFQDYSITLDASGNSSERIYLKPDTAEKIVQALNEMMQEDAGKAAPPTMIFQENKRAEDKAFLLTEKEKEVLHLLVKGYSYKMIADELDKSIETIRVQLKSIYRKLDVRSNAEAIIASYKYDLL